MKKFLWVLLLFVPAALYADKVIPVDSAGSPCTSVGSDFTSQPIDLNGFRIASFQVSSAAGSTASVTLSQRNSSTDPWAVVVTVSNPTSTELGYNGPAVGEVKVDIDWTSGAVNCSIIRNK